MTKAETVGKFCVINRGKRKGLIVEKWKQWSNSKGGCAKWEDGLTVFTLDTHRLLNLFGWEVIVGKSTIK